LDKKIRINIIPTQSLITDDLSLKGKNIVIVDILRTSSTILTSLVNGAREVIPSENINTAVRIAKGAGKNALLCGERDGKLVKGFNLGNSPLEYSREMVNDKTLIFATTNGTLSIHKSRFAKNCIIGSYLNFSSTVNFLKTLNEDFTIICAGKLGNFCLEDFIFAGSLISELYKLFPHSKYIISDSEIMALNLTSNLVYDNGNLISAKIKDMYLLSEHGKYLQTLGFESDLNFCSQVDLFNHVPVLRKGIIKFIEDFEQDMLLKQNLKKIKIDSGKHN
jgi:2-phosphosulfolactate phosphatase